MTSISSPDDVHESVGLRACCRLREHTAGSSGARAAGAGIAAHAGKYPPFRSKLVALPTKNVGPTKYAPQSSSLLHCADDRKEKTL